MRNRRRGMAWQIPGARSACQLSTSITQPLPMSSGRPASLCDLLNGLRMNGVLGPFAGIFSSAAGESADRSYGHVMVTENLAAKANAGQTPCRKHVLFGFGHHFRLAGHELDSACRAAGIPATGMKLIDAGLVGQGQDKAF